MRYLIIKKTNHKEYKIFTLNKKSGTYKVPVWWGYYNTFDKCVDVGVEMVNNHKNFEFHPDMLRRLKLKKLHGNR